MKSLPVMLFQITAIIIFVISLPGCVTPTGMQYHPVCSEGACKQDELVNSVALESGLSVSNYGWDPDRVAPSDRPDVSFYKGWLEYGDDGKALDPNQKEAIVGRVNAISAEGKKILLVVYVHGWHNNADVKEKNEGYDSIAFDSFMASYVSSVRRLYELNERTDVPVVLGVYVGWRGESVKTPLLNVLTIRGRSNAADRVGRIGVRQDLKELSDALYQANSYNKMLVVGHSLGGKVLTSAFIDEISPESPYIMNPGVLIVTINAAVTADCYTAAFEKNIPSVRPAWINITSKDDKATSLLYAIGSRLRYIRSCGSPGNSRSYAIGHYETRITENLCFRHAGRARIDHGVARINEGPSLGRLFSHVILNETEWTSARSIDAELAYPSIATKHVDTAKGQGLYNMQDADIYEVKLSRSPKFQRPMLLRNIRTDKYAIGHADGADTTDAKHNGYISTNLIRLFVEAVYSDDEPRVGLQYLAGSDQGQPKASDSEFCEYWR